MGLRSYAFDANMLLADGAAAMVASGIAQVNATPAVLDLGGNQGQTPLLQPRADYMLVIFLMGITDSNANNLYTLIVQGSNDPNFGAGNVQNLAIIDFGNTAARYGGALTTSVPAGTGSFGIVPGDSMYELPVCTEQNNQPYEFVRLNVIVAGTNPSIQFQAFLAPLLGS